MQVYKILKNNEIIDKDKIFTTAHKMPLGGGGILKNSSSMYHRKRGF